MTWALVENGTVKAVYKAAKAITVNGIQHPANIFHVWSKQEKMNIGIYDYVEVGANPDSRFYDVGSSSVDVNNNTGVVTKTFTQVEKNLATLKENKIRDLKMDTSSKIAVTDWMVIRQLEGGTAVAADVTAYRTAVRAASNDMEALITAASTMSDYIALFDDSLTLNDWPVVPDILK